VTLPATRGHAEARARLARVAAANGLAQSILLHGPPGVGKERLGLWLAQLLVCEAPNPESGPCGACLPCRLTDRLEHPDVYWFFPLPRPDASSPEKLREKLEELRAAELQARRENPHHLPAFDRAPAYFLGSIQALQQLAAVRPAMGRRKVFVVGDAERMVPQESSPEAANAFLKLLEEPPEFLTLILTSSQPGALLPTIRSRVLPLRLAPLGGDEVLDFLVKETGIDGDEAARIAALSRGAIGRALRLTPSAEGAGPLDQQRRAGREMLLAALSGGPVPRLAAAHDRPPAGARAELVGELDALAEWLRDLLAVAAGVEEEVADPEVRALLRRAADRREIHPLGIAAALERVAGARELALGNVNPQLIVADLLRGVQGDLSSGDAGPVLAGSRDHRS
jgi:DNA polymerase-3 subunit delta'